MRKRATKKETDDSNLRHRMQECAVMVLVGAQLKAEAARIMVGSPRQTEENFVMAARLAWRQAVSERDALVAEGMRKLTGSA